MARFTVDDVQQQVTQDPAAMLRRLATIDPERLKDPAVAQQVSTARQALEQLVAQQAAPVAPGGGLGLGAALGQPPGPSTAPGGIQAPNLAIDRPYTPLERVGNAAGRFAQSLPAPLQSAISGVGEAGGLLRDVASRGYDAAFASPEGQPNFMTKLGLAISSAAAGFQNPNAPNPALVYMGQLEQQRQGRQRLGLEQQQLGQQGELHRAQMANMAAERREKAIALLVQANDLPEAQRAKLSPIFKEYLKGALGQEAADVYDQVKDSPKASSVGISTLQGHPVMQALLANVKPSQAKEVLVSKEAHEQVRQHDLALIRNALSTLPPDVAKQLQGLPHSELVKVAEAFSRENSTILPAYTLQTLKDTGYGPLQELLESYGVQTERLASKKAAAETEARAKEPFTRITKETNESLIEAGYGNVDPKDITDDMIREARVASEQRQARIAGATTAGRLEAERQTKRLGERAYLWLSTEGDAAPPDMTEAQASAQGYKPVSAAMQQAATQARAVLARIPVYEKLIDKLLSKKIDAGGGVTEAFANVVARVGTATAIKVLATGGDPDARQFEALEGLITTVARAAGDTGNIAVQERLMTLQAAATKWDSRESGHAVMQQLKEILTGLVRTRGIPMGGGDQGASRTITEDQLRDIVIKARPKAK